VIVGGNTMPSIINGLRLLQSSYAKAINKQMGRTGSLFQQKARSKPVENVSEIFHYIHQLPVSAGLVVKSSDWPFSSFPDHAKLRAGTLCNSKRASEWLRPTGGEN
jgi:putative transposase